MRIYTVSVLLSFCVNPHNRWQTFSYLVLAKASCKSMPKADATPVPYAGSAL